jgi:hypothetical protein
MKALKAILATGLAALSLQASAATVFSDDFDSYAPALNAVDAVFGGNWFVTEGTVDVIGAGSGFDFYPGNGRYIDLDGSTGNAGVFTSLSLALTAGSYTLQFELGGSTRGDTNTVDVAVQVGAFAESFTLGSAAPLTLYSRTFDILADGSYTISFANQGGDNLGLILDDVSLVRNEGQVPVPATAALLGLGLLAGAARSRRR